MISYNTFDKFCLEKFKFWLDITRIKVSKIAKTSAFKALKGSSKNYVDKKR